MQTPTGARRPSIRAMHWCHQTLLKFLNWIPLGYIFETTLVRTLVYTFLPQPVSRGILAPTSACGARLNVSSCGAQAFRNDVLACLTEIGSLDIGAIYENLTPELAVPCLALITIATVVAQQSSATMLRCLTGHV